MTFNYNTGNVSIQAGNNAVVGNSTVFLQQVKAGQDLYVANNFTGTAELEYLGYVDLVVSNVLCYLHTISDYSESEMAYLTVTPTSMSHNARSATITSSSVPSGYNTVVRSIIDAADTGIFNNTQQVHSYHPPIPDPVTGVLVNMPATTFSKSADPLAVADTNISQLGYSGSNNLGVIENFDIPTGRFSTSTAYVYDGLLGAEVIRNATNLTAESDFQDSLNTIDSQTNADRYASQLGSNIKRPTDNLQDARRYFDTADPTGFLNSEQKQNLTQSDDLNNRKFDNKNKLLVTTGIPVSIPGVLNLVNKINDPVANSYVRPNFTVAQFSENK